MNNDQNFLAEAYRNIYTNKFHSEKPFNEEMVNASSEEEEYKKSAVKHKSEAADIIRHKLKLEYGHKYNETLANKAIEHALGGTSEDCEGVWMGYGKSGQIGTEQEDAETELGPDSEDVRAYDDERDTRLEYYKKICRKIKNGEMMVGDFIEWCVDHDIMPLKGEEEEAVTVAEKVKGVTKKQQALAGAVCNKKVGKHKGNPSKLRELTKCMKGVEKSEVKYNYKPKKKK